MKNTIKLLGIIALSAVIGFGLTSCGDDGGGGDGSVTVGNWKWRVYNDQQEGGSSTIQMDVNDADEKVTISGNVALLPGQTYGYTGAVGTPDAATLSALKASNGINFKILGDGKKYKFEVRLSDNVAHNHYQKVFETKENEECEIIIPYSELKQEGGWGISVPFNKQNIIGICIQARAEEDITGSGPYEFTVWDINAGVIPSEILGTYSNADGDKVEIGPDNITLTPNGAAAITLPFFRSQVGPVHSIINDEWVFLYNSLSVYFAAQSANPEPLISFTYNLDAKELDDVTFYENYDHDGGWNSSDSIYSDFTKQ